MRTLTVVTDDRWLNNDIIEQMTKLEERRVDYEAQQRFLESVFPKGSAHFDYREYGRGTSRNQRRAAVENGNGQVRKGNRTDLSDAETSVYDESRVKKYSLRPQTDTTEFQRWFKDSEVVDDEGNPLVVYHTTDSDFTTFDSSFLGSITDSNAT